MKAGKLIELLKQFDPEVNVWVVYEGVDAHPAKFVPAGVEEAADAGVEPGDLIMVL